MVCRFFKTNKCKTLLKLPLVSNKTFSQKSDYDDLIFNGFNRLNDLQCSYTLIIMFLYCSGDKSKMLVDYKIVTL